MNSILAKLATMLVLGVALLWAAPVASQEPGTKPVIKRATAPPTPADSGPAMYNAYCAACHGVRGEGNGPAVAALKVAPTNLRLLAQKNNGKYPASHVQAVLKFGAEYAAHGSSEMPVWGPTFRSLGPDGDVATLRIANLTEYLKTLQVP